MVPNVPFDFYSLDNMYFLRYLFAIFQPKNLIVEPKFQLDYIKKTVNFCLFLVHIQV